MSCGVLLQGVGEPNSLTFLEPPATYSGIIVRLALVADQPDQYVWAPPQPPRRYTSGLYAQQQELESNFTTSAEKKSQAVLLLAEWGHSAVWFGERCVAGRRVGQADEGDMLGIFGALLTNLTAGLQ